MNIMQGDAYGVPVTLRMQDGTAVTIDNVENVEIVMGNRRKTYADGDVTWNGESWVFPMTQKESFAYRNSVRYQARVKFVGGDLIGVFVEEIGVTPSDSKVEL